MHDIALVDQTVAERVRLDLQQAAWETAEGMACRS